MSPYSKAYEKKVPFTQKIANPIGLIAQKTMSDNTSNQHFAKKVQDKRKNMK